jgi:hypothetical protein
MSRPPLMWRNLCLGLVHAKTFQGRSADGRRALWVISSGLRSGTPIERRNSFWRRAPASASFFTALSRLLCSFSSASSSSARSASRSGRLGRIKWRHDTTGPGPMTESLGETLGDPTAATGPARPRQPVWTLNLRFRPFRHAEFAQKSQFSFSRQSATLRRTARGPRLRPMLWASRASLLVVTFAPPPGAAASPAAPGALRG